MENKYSEIRYCEKIGLTVNKCQKELLTGLAISVFRYILTELFLRNGVILNYLNSRPQVK